MFEQSTLCEEALRQVQNRMNPANHHDWIAYGFVMFHLGRWEETMNWFNQAMEIRPNDPEAKLHFHRMRQMVHSLVNDRLVTGTWPTWLNPVPPYLNKILAINALQNPKIKYFIETGTYFGSMIYMIQDKFDEIVSIELSQDFYKRAVGKFKLQPHIKLIQGDSGKELKKILRTLDQPCMFWLDAHYSGDSTARAERDTPILQELEAILDHHIDQHVILIDDAACFEQGWKDYPSISEVESLVKAHKPNWQFFNDQGVMRIHKST